MRLRGTVARLERTLAAFRASQPPVCFILEPASDDDSDRAAFEARVAEARRKMAAVEATGRRTAIIVVDREESDT